MPGAARDLKLDRTACDLKLDSDLIMGPEHATAIKSNVHIVIGQLPDWLERDVDLVSEAVKQAMSILGAHPLPFLVLVVRWTR